MIVKELFAKLGLEVDEGAFSLGDAAIELLHTGLLALGATAGAAALAIVGVTKKTADAAFEADRAAQKVGVSAEAWQELQFAAGPAAEAMGQALGFLSRNAAAASIGSAEASYAFRQAGVSIMGAGGQVKTADVLLEDLSDKFHAMPDGVKKTNLALELFGRGGKELIPFLNKGRDGIEELRDEARKLGVVLDRDTIESAKRYKAALHSAEGAVTGLAYAIGGPLIESFTPVIEAIGAWVSANREWIAQKIHSAIHSVATAAGLLWTALGPLLAALGRLVTSTMLWKTAMVLLGAQLTLMALRAIPVALTAVLELVTAIRAVGVASAISAGIAAAAPYLIAAAWLALGVIIFLVLEDVYQFVTGGKSVLGDFWEWLKEQAPKAWAEVTKWLGEVFSTAVDYWKGLLGEFWTWVSDKAKGAGKAIGDALTGALKDFLSVLPGGDAISARLFASPAAVNESAFGAPASSPGAGVAAAGATRGGATVGGVSIGQISVTAPAGADGREFGEAASDAIEERQNAMLREALSAVQGG